MTCGDFDGVREFVSRRRRLLSSLVRTCGDTVDVVVVVAADDDSDDDRHHCFDGVPFGDAADGSSNYRGGKNCH